jgi:hypothetical protein
VIETSQVAGPGSVKGWGVPPAVQADQVDRGGGEVVLEGDFWQSAEVVVDGGGRWEVAGQLPPRDPAAHEVEDRVQQQAARMFLRSPSLPVVLPGGGNSGSKTSHSESVNDEDG